MVLCYKVGTKSSYGPFQGSPGPTGVLGYDIELSPNTLA